MSQYLPLFPQNMYPQYSGMPFFGQPYPTLMPPVIKNYSINTDGPGANHQRLAIVYEDIMPTKPFVPSSTTLGERLNIYQFVRSSIFSNVDGANISLDGYTQVGGGNSLLSFIKFGDLNPYNTYKLSNNKYRGLPPGYLIYRTCYPIREDAGKTTCSKDSTSVNVRIYKMLEGSFMVNRTSPEKFYEYDEWREVAFYEYVRENIIKKKVCPHFVGLYGYFIAEKCGIDFDGIELIKNSKVGHTEEPKYVPHTGKDPATIFSSTLKEIPSLHQSKAEIDEIVKLNTPSIFGVTRPQTVKYVNKNDNTLVEINPNSYTGKTLVMLTESPTYNLIGWATRTYQQTGNVRVMINRGIHSADEWLNIYFQIMVGLYVMQINKIYINNFSVENNILIKDLTLRGAITNYWKYKIGEIDFYIPNIGFLVMLDSNYKDLQNNSATKYESTFDKSATNTEKIGGKFLGKNCKIDDKQIRDKVFDMFKQAFDINVFDKDFDSSGGCRPPAEITDMISNINNDIMNDIANDTKDIKKYIVKYMTKFLHNRTGTYLREAEVLNIRRDDTREFKKGQLVVYEDAYGTFKFVIYLETQPNGLAKILTKNDPADLDIIEDNKVPITALLNYSRAEPIYQTFKSNEANMNEEDLLETYVIKN